MKIAIIGTGNMAHFLSQKLQQSHIELKAVWGRDYHKAIQLAKESGAEAVKNIEELNEELDACLLAVSDDAIPEVAEQIKGKDKVLIHTSGAQSLDILPQKNSGVIWPVYSLIKDGPPIPQNIPIAYDYHSEKAKKIIIEIVGVLTTLSYYADNHTRKWMHLMATIGNNFTNHLMAVAEVLAAENGIAFDVFRPILQQTYERIKIQSPQALQSGAAIRGDHETMTMHQNLLTHHPLWQDLYKIISASIKEMHHKEGE